MGAIQGAINSMFSSAAVGLGATKVIKQQATANEQQAKLIKQGQQTMEAIKGMPSPMNFSAATTAYNNSKMMQAMDIMSNNGVPAYTQRYDFDQRLEQTRGQGPRASRNKLKGGKK